MEVLGVGPLELLLVIIIALIVMGPRDMAVAARKVGRFLNQLYKSETWRTVMEASRSLRTLPNRLAREAALEELDEIRDDIQKSGQEIRADVEKAGQRVSTDYGLQEGKPGPPPEAGAPEDQPPDQGLDSSPQGPGRRAQRVSTDFGLPEEEPQPPPKAGGPEEGDPDPAGDGAEEDGETG